ncbi:MAG TPA: hypothetical protein VKX17_06560 [Planctomycetota bacterium]|nr:hypothetical protein [Planctomycetota bacterium]
MASSPEKSDNKYLAPSVVAALVWLALSIYMFKIVPRQVEWFELQFKKPEAMMPDVLRYAARFDQLYGTAIISFLGLAGCGLAYIRRSAKLANTMILIGAVLLIGLVWAILAALSKTPLAK